MLVVTDAPRSPRDGSVGLEPRSFAITDRRVSPSELPPSLVGSSRSSRTTRERYEVEFRLRRVDGEHRWHLGRAAAERDEDGTIKRWVGTNTDIHAGGRSRGADSSLAIRAAFDRHRKPRSPQPIQCVALGID